MLHKMNYQKQRFVTVKCFVSIISTKKIVLALVFVFACIAAMNGQMLEKKVTIVEQGIQLTEILRKIEDQAGVQFSFNSKIVPKDKTVTLNCLNCTLDEVLAVVFADLGISYKELNKQLVLYKKVTPPSGESYSKPNIQRSSKQGVKRLVRYVYDTIRQVVIDTLVTYTVDTLLVTDTLVYMDTVKVSVFDQEPKNRFSISFTFSSPLTIKRTLTNTSDEALFAAESAFTQAKQYSYQLSGTFYAKGFTFSLGAGLTNVTESIDFFRQAEIALIAMPITVQYDTSYFVNETVKDYIIGSYEKRDPATGEITVIYDSVPYKRTVVKPVTLRLEKDTIVEVADSLQAEIAVSMARDAYYFSLPLKIGYKLDAGKRFSLSACAGLECLFLIGLKNSVRYNNYLPEKGFLNKTVFCGTAELSFSYKLDRHIGVYAGANYKGDLNSRYRTDYGLQKKHRSVGYHIGLSYLF